MKKIIILKTILLIGILTSCKTFHSKSEKENFDYFSRKSTFLDFKNLDKINRKWREKNNDTVIYTTYFKGAVCDIPNEEEMNIKISNDTLYFNFGLAKISPDCEKEIGVAGIMVDFVLN